MKKALANLAAMADEKRKAGRDVPFLNWRYILFNWNDSDEEMALARKMAVEIGVDRLCWEITDHPEDAFSRRFMPGAPDYARIAHEVWDTSGLGTPSPARRRGRRSTSGRCCPACRSWAVRADR